MTMTEFALLAVIAAGLAGNEPVGSADCNPGFTVRMHPDRLEINVGARGPEQPEEIRISCKRLQATTEPATFACEGDVQIEGGGFRGHADRIEYDLATNHLRLSSSGERNAEIWRWKSPGDRPSQITARRIDFRLRENWLKVQSTSSPDLVQ